MLIAYSSTLCVILVALIVLAGWLFNLPLLTQFHEGWPAMVPNTALCFIGAGIALLLIASGRAVGVGKLLALLLLLASAVISAEWVADADWGFRYWLFGEALRHSPIYRVAPGTAVCFMLVALLLLAHGQPRLRRISEVVLYTLGIMAVLRFAAFPFGVVEFAALRGFRTMAYLTSACFLLLWLALTLLRGPHGVLGLLLSQRAGGRMARSLLLVALLIPFINGSLRVALEQRGLVQVAEGALLAAMINAIMFALFVIWAGQMLNSADADRDSKQAELQRSELRLRRLFDSPMLGIFNWDAEGWVTDANDRFLQMLGFTRQDVASGWMSWTREEPRRGASALDGMDRHTAPYEKELSRADGTVMPVVVGAVMPDDELEEGVGFILDNTERKRSQELIEQRNRELEQLAEELRTQRETIEARNAELEELAAQLARNEAKLRAVFESSLLGMFFWRIDGTILDANPRFFELTGYTAADIGVLTYDKLAGTGNDSSTQARRRDVQQRDWLQPVEVVITRADGGALPIVITSMMLDHAAQEGVSLFLDVREQHAARELLEQRNQELARSAERLRAIFESPLSAMAFYTVGGAITEGNQRFIEMTGLDPAEIAAGRVNWRDLTPPELRERDQEQAGRIERDGVIPPEEDILLCADGTRLHVLAGGALLPGGANECVAFLLDVSERHAAQLLVQRRNAELESLNEELRRSQLRLRGLFESPLIGAYFWQIDGRITAANQHLLDLAGYTAADVEEGRLSWAVLAGPGREDRAGLAARVLRERGSFGPAETEIVHSSGRMLQVLTGAVMLDREREEGVAFMLDVSRQHAARLLIEQRNAELEQLTHKLQLSQQHLRRLFESPMLGIFYWNLEGRILDANDRFLSMLGFAHDDLEAGRLSWANVAPPEFAAIDELKSAQLATTGAMEPYEKEFIRADGTRLPVLVGAATLDMNKLEGVAYATDISELRRSREQLEARHAELEQLYLELKRSEDRLRLLFDSPLIGVSSWRLDGALLDANDKFLSMLGYTRGQLADGSLNWQAITPATGREELQRRTAELLRSRAMEPYEREFIRADGSVLPVLIGAALLQGSEDEGVSFVLDVSDQHRSRTLIEQRNAELEGLTAELARSQARLQRMFDAPLIGVSYWRDDGVILGANELFLQLLRYTQADIERGLSWQAIVPEEFLSPELREERLRVLAAGETTPPVEVELRRGDGSMQPVLLVSMLLDGPAGEREGVTFVLDITAQRAVREQIETRNAELQRINAELDSFSYSVSHDLRAPLRAIEGFSKALEEDYADKLDDDAQRYIERIRSGTIRMAQLIDDLLQLSRVARTELNIQLVDISELALLVSQVLSDSAPQRTVEWKIAPGLITEGDPRMLRIVLENLLGNAFKFTGGREAPVIEFGRAMTSAGMAFHVRDNGAGFDMTYANKLFTAFQRLHSNAQFPGTGIGLSIVRRIIGRHGGEVWAESAPDCGASFYFTLSLGGGNG